MERRETCGPGAPPLWSRRGRRPERPGHGTQFTEVFGGFGDARWAWRLRQMRRLAATAIPSTAEELRRPRRPL